MQKLLDSKRFNVFAIYVIIVIVIKMANLPIDDHTLDAILIGVLALIGGYSFEDAMEAYHRVNEIVMEVIGGSEETTELPEASVKVVQKIE